MAGYSGNGITCEGIGQQKCIQDALAQWSSGVCLLLLEFIAGSASVLC